MWHALGKVTIAAPGTALRATNNESDPTARYPCHAAMFQQLPAQTGKIYVCDREDANTTTFVGVLAVLPIPTTNTLPSVSAGTATFPISINLNEIWIDAEVQGEGCLVSAVR